MMDHEPHRPLISNRRRRRGGQRAGPKRTHAIVAKQMEDRKGLRTAGEPRAETRRSLSGDLGARPGHSHRERWPIGRDGPLGKMAHWERWPIGKDGPLGKMGSARTSYRS